MGSDDPISQRFHASLPSRLAELPRDHRGYPITYVTVIRSDGRPDFTEVDGARRLECIRDELCGLCGQTLGYWRAVIGGPLVMRSRLTLDPPMHVECATFAATDPVSGCPFLLHMGFARYAKSTNANQGARPRRMFLAKTRSHELKRDGADVLAHCAPFKEVWEILAGSLVKLRDTASWP